MYKKRALNYTDSNKLKAEIFEISFKVPYSFIHRVYLEERRSRWSCIYDILLPQDTRYRILFLLPRRDSNVHSVLAVLNGNNFLQSIGELEETSIHLSLPRTVVKFLNSTVETLKQVVLYTSLNIHNNIVPEIRRIAIFPFVFAGRHNVCLWTKCRP